MNSNQFGIRKIKGQFYEENYKYIIEVLGKDEKSYVFSSNSLKKLFGGILTSDRTFKLGNMLHTVYKDIDESKSIVLQNMEILERFIKHKLGKDYFKEIIYMMDKQVQEQKLIKVYKNGYEKFKTLAKIGIFNNIKVQIAELESKVELNGKIGYIKGYKTDLERFIVILGTKRYLIKYENLIYMENFLKGYQESIFNKYIKKSEKYPTTISFKMFNENDDWNTKYSNICTNDVIERTGNARCRQRDDNILKQWLKTYKFAVKFTPKIYVTMENYRIFVNIDLLLLDLKFTEKEERLSFDDYDFIED